VAAINKFKNISVFPYEKTSQQPTLRSS